MASNQSILARWLGWSAVNMFGYAWAELEAFCHEPLAFTLSPAELSQSCLLGDHELGLHELLNAAAF